MHTILKRSAIGTLLAFGSLAITSGSALAASYPSEPIEVVVSYAPGGVSDLMARSFASALEQHLDKTTVVVQNRPGAAGIIGTNYVYNAKPDGHTLLLARIAVLAVAPALQKVPYDPDAFSYVGLLATDPYACVTGTRKPYQSLDDLKAAIHQKKGAVTYSSSGVGSLNQFGALRLLELLDVGDAKTVATHVPSTGEGPALTAVAGGHIDFFCGNVAPILPQIKSGTVRGLIVTSEKRMPDLPDVPTASELGLGDFNDIVGWSAMIAPPNTDEAAISALGEAMQDIKNDSAWQEHIVKLGAVPAILTPEETREFVQKQRKLYADMVERLDLRKK